jgi:hypothetical protein
MKSKKYLGKKNKSKRKNKRNKTLRRKKYFKGGFPTDTINYNEPIMKMYNEDYMEKDYLNQYPNLS